MQMAGFLVHQLRQKSPNTSDRCIPAQVLRDAPASSTPHCAIPSYPDGASAHVLSSPSSYQLQHALHGVPDGLEGSHSPAVAATPLAFAFAPTVAIRVFVCTYSQTNPMPQRSVAPSYGALQSAANRDMKVPYTVGTFVKHAWPYALGLVLVAGITYLLITTHHSCPKGQVTVLQNGKRTCGQCNANSDCGHGTVCSGSTCVQCVKDGDCKTDAQPNAVCDVTTNTCTISCTDNGDCVADAAAAGPICNTASNRCVNCLVDGDCTNPDAPYCLADHTCGECTVSQHCDDGRVCKDPSGGANPVCLDPCTSDAGCTDPDFPLCHEGACLACVPDQVNSGTCKGSTAGPYCAADGLSCGDCSTDTDCKSAWFVCNPDRMCEKMGGAAAITATVGVSGEGTTLEATPPESGDVVAGSTRLGLALATASATPSWMFIPQSAASNKWAMLATPARAAGSGTPWVASVYGCCGGALSSSTTCTSVEGTTCTYDGVVQALVREHPYTNGLTYTVQIENAGTGALVLGNAGSLPASVRIRAAGVTTGGPVYLGRSEGTDVDIRWTSEVANRLTFSIL